MLKDTLADIQRDMLVFLKNATAALDEAERLLTCSHMGTEKWVAELEAWQRAKRKVINCQD